MCLSCQLYNKMLVTQGLSLSSNFSRQQENHDTDIIALQQVHVYLAVYMMAWQVMS